MSHPYTFTAENSIPERADKSVSVYMDSISRSQAAGLIESGNVLINGEKAGKSTKVKLGDTVSVTLPEPVMPNASPEKIPLDIVYEDKHLLVVNKPKGMVVHPAPGNHGGTLVNALLAHCGEELSGINGVLRPGIVHRIDKDTSGLLIVAKTDTAHRGLAAQIKEHSFTRVYEALVCGLVKPDSGTVNASIGRHPVKRKQMAVTARNSKPAVTRYEVLARFERDKITRLRLQLETGRTHQIRAHMAYLHHPVLGDMLYGGRAFAGLSGQCLHAREIGFVHPDSGEELSFSSELPEYFLAALSEMKNENGGLPINKF
ncbi:MAG: RluA family pseudouridine synthase [Oscillospiraceae bacterium]|jgi:23S rRNA pseudouridine1911/1915/1917 synthase|nr:RluA family pseudouridine synthase [Oscillospiraceae bacterium]